MGALIFCLIMVLWITVQCAILCRVYPAADWQNGRKVDPAADPWRADPDAPWTELDELLAESHDPTDSELLFDYLLPTIRALYGSSSSQHDSFVN